MSKFILIFLVATIPLNAENFNWKSFDDPDAALSTGDFAKTISALPRPEKIGAIGRLNWSLSSADSEIRRRAALTLGALGDHRGVPVMIADMKITDARLRGNTAVALRVLKDRRAIPVLRSALSDKSPYVRGIALVTLGELKATEALLEVAGHLRDKETEGDSCIVMYPAEDAAYALGAMGDPEAIPFLIQSMDDADIQTSVTQSLSSLTGEQFGKDTTRWKNWWNATRKKE